MQLSAASIHVPLVICGHMHHRLYGNKSKRRMVHVCVKTGRVTLNAATVPRVMAPPSEASATRSEAVRAAALAREDRLSWRHFLVVGQLERDTGVAYLHCWRQWR
jgi:hypothetical protein